MKINKKTIFYLLFVLIGVFMFWIALKNQDFSEILKQIYLADYSWAILIFFITVVNHIFRALRWTLLFEPLRYEISVKNAFLAILFGYFVSLGIPRFGEISRCIVLKQQNNVPVNISIGTVFTERLIDIFCLFILIVSVFFFQHAAFEAIFRKFIISPIQNILIADAIKIIFLLSLLIIVISILIFLIFKKYKNILFFEKCIQFLSQVKAGILSFIILKNKKLFFLYTVLIWVGYFFMTYCWFPSLKATSQLSWEAGFTLLVVGSLGKSVPIQGGGFGAYHFLITQTLIFFGVASQFGFALAMIIHGFQTLFYLISGIAVWIYLLFEKRNISPNSFNNK